MTTAPLPPIDVDNLVAKLLPAMMAVLANMAAPVAAPLSEVKQEGLLAPAKPEGKGKGKVEGKGNKDTKEEIPRQNSRSPRRTQGQDSVPQDGVQKVPEP